MRCKMIYITGDCHRDFRRFNTRIFPEQKEMTKDDFVIICGDFGGASSHDVSGGILDRSDLSYQEKKRKHFRNGFSAIIMTIGM